MPKNETNTEFVTRLMDFAKCGGMMQLFVLDACNKQAAKIAAIPRDELHAAFGPRSLVDPDAWQAAAREWMEETNKRNGQ